MSAYMKKKEVVNYLIDMDEDFYSHIIFSLNKLKQDNVDIPVLEELFVKHMKSEGINAMSKLESEVTTYYDSEYFMADEDHGPWMDAPILDEEDDDWFDGDRVQF